MSEFDRAPNGVLEQLEEVRSLGPCNMMDIPCVTRIAGELGMYELQAFCVNLQENRTERGKRWIQLLNEMVHHDQTTTTS
jgi:hypothetical protein